MYARNVLTKDPGTLAVWRLAKAVHKSLDSSFHQVSVTTCVNTAGKVRVAKVCTTLDSSFHQVGGLRVCTCVSLSCTHAAEELGARCRVWV